MRWDLRAAVTQVCQFDWNLDPSVGERVSGSIEVRGRARTTGKQSELVAFDDAVLNITTTCPDWTFSLQGVRE